MKLRTQTGETLDEVLTGISHRSPKECQQAFAQLEEGNSPDLIVAIEVQAQRGLGTRQIFEARIQGVAGLERGALEVLALGVEYVVRRVRAKAK